MAKTKISEFSATPGNNTDIDGINIAEGCAPSGINDAIRELMAQLKDWQAGTSNDPYVVGSSGSLTLSYGTANGVPYLNGSKVLTSGSALTFDGTTFGVTATAAVKSDTTPTLNFTDVAGSIKAQFVYRNSSTGNFEITNATNAALVFGTNNTEQMRLTSTGLGIGTSSPAQKLHVDGRIAVSGSGYTVNSTNGLIGAYNGTMYLQMPSGNNLQIWKSTTDAVATFDQSGNLGLGVTPSAWNGSYKNIQIPSGSYFATSGQYGFFTSNVYLNGSAVETYISNGAAMKYTHAVGQHQWHIAPSGTAGNAISFTQAMTLDASGNLVVGDTTANRAGASHGISVNGTSSSVLETNYASARAGNMYSYASGTNIGEVRNLPLIFTTNDTERARIDSSGNLLVGTTSSGARMYVRGPASASYPSGIGLIESTTSGDLGYPAFQLSKYDNNTTTSQIFVKFLVNNGSTAQGQINANGASAVAFGSWSDRRLKENIADLPSQLANIMALRPVEFDYIESEGGGHQIGFVAQEVQEIYPDLVGERTDGMLTLTDLNKNDARLIKAIQEQQAIINQLKARLDAANL